MARKKHAPKAKTNAPRNRKRHLSAVPSPRRSAFELELDRTQVEFSRWLAEQSPVAIDGSHEAMAEFAIGIARVARVHDPSFRVTRWRVDDLVEIQHALESDMMDEDTSPAMLFIPVAALVQFMWVTDRWTGSDLEYADVVTALAELCGGLDGAGHFGIPDLPEIDPEVESAALRALPLVRRLGDLLRWIGEGRPVTSTGALRLKDVGEAAGLVGVDIDVAKNSARSMWDVVDLARLWSFAIETQLIAVTRTKAVLLPRAESFVGTGPTTTDQAFHIAAAQFVATVLIPDEAGWGPRATDAAHSVMHILADALRDDPAPIDSLVDDVAEPGIVGLIVTSRARAILETLRDAGLVEVGQAYTVPDALKQVVRVGLLAADSESPDDFYSPALDSSDRDVYRLRVGLHGSSPPIWRSFEIAGDAPLEVLHVAIQSSFDWMDEHLHEFRIRRSRKPLDDERRIDAVLRKVGDVVTYVYDFGDDWQHTVEVEEIVPGDDSVAIRFVDGRGMAPEEDSGGVWGWSHKIDAANDPASPDYDSVREWLDLAPGERLDPTEFDADAVATRLANLNRAIGW